MRKVAASATGPMAAMGKAPSVQTMRMPQKSWTKNSPIGITAPSNAPMTITCRQSLARSAMRPTKTLSSSMMKTGSALITPTSVELSPLSVNQMPA